MRRPCRSCTPPGGIAGDRAHRVSPRRGRGGGPEGRRAPAAGRGQDELGLGLDERARRRGRPLAIIRRGWVTCWTPSSTPTGARVRARRRRGRGVPAVGAGPDHRAGQQARQPAGAGGGRGQRAVLPDPAAAPARLCEGGLATAAVRRLRRARGAGPASLVLYDVSTLYFETDAGDGFREPGSPRNAGWSRRSPSACSPIRPGSR